VAHLHLHRAPGTCNKSHEKAACRLVSRAFCDARQPI